MPSKSLPWLQQTLPYLRGLEPGGNGRREGPVCGGESRREQAADVLDLALSVGGLLCESGASAEETVGAMIVTARAYGMDECQPDVTLSGVELSVLVPGEALPVLGRRAVRFRVADFAAVEGIHQLVRDIHEGRIGLLEAREAASELGPASELPGTRRPWRRRYAGHALAGSIAGSASVFTGASVGIALCAFVAAALGNMISDLLARYGVPAFYLFALASMPAAAIAVAVHAAAPAAGGQAVIVGGVLGLLPAMAATSAVQDGLTGHYLTATARLLHTLIIFVAVVLGTGIVLGLAARAGVQTPAPPPPIPSWADYPGWWLIMVGVFAIAIAAHHRVPPAKWCAVGLLGVAGLVSCLEAQAWGLSPIAATAIAAVIVSAGGQMLARRSQSSALPWAIPAAAPLLPGTLIYRALRAMVDGEVLIGVTGLAQAFGVLLALAGGISLTGELTNFMRLSRAARRAAAARLQPDPQPRPDRPLHRTAGGHRDESAPTVTRWELTDAVLCTGEPIRRWSI
ncbi:threonine/serine ThrE exporter family protein [Streptomyces sp. IBSNAI002]|uniref:threonine/serine ThrE exporter family protein n=1 Tax=Streptomyces sp. IBSNAI002 TaxID=3457500 RepID=UPI003FD6261B